MVKHVECARDNSEIVEYGAWEESVRRTLSEVCWELLERRRDQCDSRLCLILQLRGNIRDDFPCPLPMQISQFEFRPRSPVLPRTAV